MSVKVKALALESIKKAEQIQTAMHGKAGEMIELMKLVRADALKRRNQYRRMVKAGEAGRFKEVKQLHTEMLTWRKYKISL